MSLRSPLGRARGLGSAKEGVHHFWVQRLSAIALIPLTLLFIFNLANIAGADYETVRWWVGYPYISVLLVLFLGAGFYHGALGLQVVIEDYVSSEFTKLVTLLVVKAAMLVGAVASIFAVLKIALS